MPARKGRPIAIGGLVAGSTVSTTARTVKTHINTHTYPRPHVHIPISPAPSGPRRAAGPPQSPSRAPNSPSACPWPPFLSLSPLFLEVLCRMCVCGCVPGGWGVGGWMDGRGLNALPAAHTHTYIRICFDRGRVRGGGGGGCCCFARIYTFNDIVAFTLTFAVVGYGHRACCRLPAPSIDRSRPRPALCCVYVYVQGAVRGRSIQCIPSIDFEIVCVSQDPHAAAVTGGWSSSSLREALDMILVPTRPAHAPTPRIKPTNQIYRTNHSQAPPKKAKMLLQAGARLLKGSAAKAAAAGQQLVGGTYTHVCIQG